MNDQQLLTHEWKSIRHKKKRKNKLSTGKLYVRYTPRKNGRYTMAVYIGIDILQRMNWKAGDYFDVLRHEAKHTQFVVLPDLQGSKLSLGKKAHCGIISVVTDKSYPFDDDVSISVSFMECRNYIMFDIGRPQPEGFDRA